jgi:hypothetical protein
LFARGDIIDGKTAVAMSYEIKSDAKEIYVGAAVWQVLCHEIPDEKVLREFRSSGFDYFQEPFGNW